MSQYAIRTRLNLVLVSLVVLINIFSWLVAPFCLSPVGVALFLLFDCIVLRLTNLHWHLIHEAVHGILAKPRWLNELLGNLLSFVFNSSFAALRQGHLTHHRLNRTADVAEVYFDQRQPGRLAYYADILGGFFLVYCFLFPMLAWLPKQQ